jgi:hypothetical protein
MMVSSVAKESIPSKMQARIRACSETEYSMVMESSMTKQIILPLQASLQEEKLTATVGLDMQMEVHTRV